MTEREAIAKLARATELALRDISDWAYDSDWEHKGVLVSGLRAMSDRAGDVANELSSEQQDPEPIEPGQLWRRKSDGVLFEVLSDERCLTRVQRTDKPQAGPGRICGHDLFREAFEPTPYRREATE